MPFLFTCPHCGTRTEVEDQYRGMAGSCVTCAKPIQLPAKVGDESGAGTSGRRRASVTPARRKSWPAIVGATSVLVMLLGSMGYFVIRHGTAAVTKLQTSQSRLVSSRNLTSIARALNNYAADHGSYPPPMSTDSAGKPLHSWRVLILPYLGERDLYESIDLTQAWSSEINQSFQWSVPDVYAHPRSSGRSYASPYQLVIGKRTLFPDAQTARGPGDLVDSPNKTLLVIECQPNVMQASWMAPGDLMLDDLLIDGTTFWSEVEGVDPDGMMVVTVSGSTGFIGTGASPLTIEALSTYAGGEPIPDDVLD